MYRGLKGVDVAISSTGRRESGLMTMKLWIETAIRPRESKHWNTNRQRERQCVKMATRVRGMANETRRGSG
jgi:antirestriction protein ArdC